MPPCTWMSGTRRPSYSSSAANACAIVAARCRSAGSAASARPARVVGRRLGRARRRGACRRRGAAPLGTSRWGGRTGAAPSRTRPPARAPATPAPTPSTTAAIPRRSTVSATAPVASPAPRRRAGASVSVTVANLARPVDGRRSASTSRPRRVAGDDEGAELAFGRGGRDDEHVSGDCVRRRATFVARRAANHRR